MKYLDKIRADIAAKLAERAALLDTMQAVGDKAADESRSMTAEETVSFDEARGKITALDAEVLELNERAAELEAIEARTAEVAKMKSITFGSPTAKPVDVIEDRAATPLQLADALTRSVEGHLVDRPDSMAHVRSLAKRHANHTEWARQLVLRSSDTYVSAFTKLITGNSHLLTPEEARTAMSVGTAANGGYLVPTHLDPTVIVTNNGSSNAIRRISRVTTLTVGKKWEGVSSAGVTASWDGELAEVSDDTPTFANPEVDTFKAQAFVQASIEATQDIGGLAAELGVLLADAKDRLEAAAHATGTGSGQPTGIFTAIDAVSGSEIVSDTAATIALADLHEVYYSVPVRHRATASWVMNPVYSMAIKALGTAVSASFTTDLTQGSAGTLLGRPLVESDEAPTTQTTTVRDNELILGDFSKYLIVDMPGGMSVEYIPHMFNTSNNLPDGRRGWYAYWRTGANVLDANAFRLLQDRTSA